MKNFMVDSEPQGERKWNSITKEREREMGWHMSGDCWWMLQPQHLFEHPAGEHPWSTRWCGREVSLVPGIQSWSCSPGVSQWDSPFLQWTLWRISYMALAGSALSECHSSCCCTRGTDFRRCSCCFHRGCWCFYLRTHCSQESGQSGLFPGL